MIKVFLVLLLFSINSFAQNLYDSNCAEYIKTNNLIKANSFEDSILKSKRTERYFYWERINKKYRELSNDPSLIKEANERFKDQRSEYSISKCNGELADCNSYKAYCIEEVATKGMIEKIHEWNDRVNNCMSSKYRVLHPDFCKKDFKRSLLYLKNMANQLAKTNQEKSLEVAQFFQEAKETFQKNHDQMDKLLIAIAKEKKREEVENLQAINKEKVHKTLNMCRDLIKSDDNDIGNKIYVDKILMSYSCPSLAVPTDLNKEAINSLEKIMSTIDLKTQEKLLYPQITALALNKSIKATAATYMRFFGNDLNLNDSSSINKFVKNICSKLEKDYCKKPALKASMYIALRELNEETKSNPLTKISKEEIYKDLNIFNNTLKQANSFCSTINKEAKKIEKENNCKDLPRAHDKFDRNSKYIVDATIECNKRRQKKYAKLNDLTNSNRLKAEQYYAKASGTLTGHLLVTEDFREKVNLPSRAWVNEKCIKGDGEAFKTPSRTDVDKGLKDFMLLNLKEISDIADQKENPNNKRKIIKDYLKNNPNTIVSLLEENPEEEYAKAICGFVREINDSDYYKVIGERAVIGVGVVAGVALSITGIGAPIGVPLLATVGTVTAIEAGSIIYDISKINYNLQNKRQASSTGQMNNDQALEEFKTAEDELFSRKVDLALTLSFGTLDLVSEGAKSARLFYKTNKALKTKNILGLGKDLSKESLKGLSYNITKGFDSFAYQAKKFKIDPKSIKALSDSQKMELGAIYSRLTRSEQKILTEILSRTNNPKELSSLINKVSESKDIFSNTHKIDFQKIFKIVNRSTKSLPSSKGIESLFRKSDKLLDLNTVRLSNNKDVIEAEKFKTQLQNWYSSEDVILNENLNNSIKSQLTSNGIVFKDSSNGYILTAKELAEGEQYTSEIERFVNRMNKMGVNVKYDPQFLKQNNIQGAYDIDMNTVYIDNTSILSNRTSPISFHEGSHVHGIEKYLKGIDDNFNISFGPDARSPSSKIFAPSEELFKKHNTKDIPYAEGFWAQESKVFSNELRQNAWSETPNLNKIRKNSETLNLINQNAIVNSKRVIDHVRELNSYITKGHAGMANRVIEVEKEYIKGQAVRSFTLKNYSVTIDPIKRTRSDIKTKIKAVTEYQKDLAQRYISDKENPKILKEILEEFNIKATNYKELSLKNEQVNNLIIEKANKLLVLNKPVTKKDQKEFIDLTAKLSRTTKIVNSPD